jgi:hypothetical protein
MAVLGRVNMIKARQKQARYFQESKEAREKRLEEQKNSKPLSEEEHNKRLELLKNMGLLKEEANE